MDTAETGASTLVLATMPGDDPLVGARWADALRRAGYEVHSLGVRAPAPVSGHAIALPADALVLPVGRRGARQAVQQLVARLHRQHARVAVLLGGPGVDEAFAQWLAVAQDDAPYWGGVYYCEDVAEARQVLQQIVLFTPEPPAHSHATPEPACEPDEAAAGGCAGCSLGCGNAG